MTKLHPIQRIARFGVRQLLQVPNQAMRNLEPLLAPRSIPPSHAPVFILGAPRSGSTLLYQVLINRFGFGYLANAHCAFYGFPYLLQLALRSMPRGASPDRYQSTHGRVEGWWSPSECGDFWYRWFRRRPQYVGIDDVSPRALRSLRRVISGLTAAFRSPLLFKNLLNGLRLGPLISALPEAAFIVIRRDLLRNAASLLVGRMEVFGDLTRWWSVEPPGISELRALEPEEQVVQQIRRIYAVIDNHAQSTNNGRFFTVGYEELCTDTHGTLQAIHSFLRECGITVAERGEVPASFEIAGRAALEAGILRRLRAAVESSASPWVGDRQRR